MGRDVQLQQSRGKGTGVYAMVPLKQGQLVVRYSGPLRRKEDHAAKLEQGMTTGDYAFRLGADWVIDGEVPESSSWGRFINHSKRRCNCEPVPVGPHALASTLNLGDTWQNALVDLVETLRLPFPVSPFAVFIETTKEIEVGEELLFDCE